MSMSGSSFLIRCLCWTIECEYEQRQPCRHCGMTAQEALAWRSRLKTRAILLLSILLTLSVSVNLRTWHRQHQNSWSMRK